MVLFLNLLHALRFQNSGGSIALRHPKSSHFIELDLYTRRIMSLSMNARMTSDLSGTGQVFYNRLRLHSTQGYLTPNGFEARNPCKIY